MVDSKKRCAALLAGLMLVGSIGLAFGTTTNAYAAETTRSYTWRDGESQPSVPNSITEGGVEYTLVSRGNPTQSTDSRQLTQYFSQTIDSTIPADQIGNLLNLVPTTYPYSSDGYSGNLSRGNIQTTEVYANSSSDVTTERSGTIPSTEQPTDDSVPQTVTQDGDTYTLTSVDWTPGETSYSGSTVTWDYTAHYAGTHTESVLDHYRVSTTYDGNLTKTVTDGGTWSMTVTYRSDDTQANATNDTDNSNVTYSDGVTAKFNDMDTFESNPVDGQTSQNGDNLDNASNGLADNQNGNGGTIRNEDPADGASTDNSSSAPSALEAIRLTKPDGSINIIPIALLVGLLALIAAFAFFLRRRKKGATVAAGIDAPAASGVATPYLIPVDGMNDLDAELIEYVDDGTDENQTVIASLDAQLSTDADTPTLVTIPAAPETFNPAVIVDTNGDYVLDENGNPIYAEYYVALSDVSSESAAYAVTDNDGKVSFDNLAEGYYQIRATDTEGNVDIKQVRLSADRVQEVTLYPTEGEFYDVSRESVGKYLGISAVIVSVIGADGEPIPGAYVDVLRANILKEAKSDRLVIVANNQLLYDGPLDSQILLDGTLLADALNGTVPAEDRFDMSEDIAAWNESYEKADDNRIMMLTKEAERQAQHEADAHQTEDSIVEDPSEHTDDKREDMFPDLPIPMPLDEPELDEDDAAEEPALTIPNFDVDQTQYIPTELRDGMLELMDDFADFDTDDQGDDTNR